MPFFSRALLSIPAEAWMDIKAAVKVCPADTSIKTLATKAIDKRAKETASIIRIHALKEGWKVYRGAGKSKVRKNSLAYESQNRRETTFSELKKFDDFPTEPGTASRYKKILEPTPPVR
jgi:hypothetical protein